MNTFHRSGTPPVHGPPERHERFTALFDDTYAAVLRFIERRAHPSHAEDLAADVYVVVWRRLDDLPTSADEQRAWIFGIARRVLLAGQRGDRRQRDLAVRIGQESLGRGEHELADLSEAGHDDLIASRVDLARAWERLPAGHQEALALTVWDGLDAPHAAAVLGISPVAYRLRLSRARKALRALVGALPARSPRAVSTKLSSTSTSRRTP